MTALQLILAAFFIAANGFFVAVEFSLVATPRSALDRLAKEGNRRAKIALASTGDLGRQLAGAQFGITITSLALGYIAESAIANIVQDIFEGLGSAITHGVAGAIAVGTMVVLQMLLGEMIPKNAAIAVPVRMTLWIALPHRLFVTAFRPLISSINWLGSQGVALLGVTPPTEVDETRTPAELASLLERSRRQGGIDDTEHDLLTGALDFGEQTVAGHLVPRSKVVSARRNSTAADLEQLLVASGHSRLPLYAQSLEDAVSFVHAKDLLRIEESARNSPLPSSLVRPLPSVSGGELLEDVLVKMRRESQHIALVRIANGEVAGLITLEDVLEALIGDIEDESDKSESNSDKI